MEKLTFNEKMVLADCIAMAAKEGFYLREYFTIEDYDTFIATLSEVLRKLEFNTKDIKYLIIDAQNW